MNFERDEIETQKNGIIYMIWHMIATKKDHNTLTPNNEIMWSDVYAKSTKKESEWKTKW